MVRTKLRGVWQEKRGRCGGSTSRGSAPPSAPAELSFKASARSRERVRALRTECSLKFAGWPIVNFYVLVHWRAACWARCGSQARRFGSLGRCAQLSALALLLFGFREEVQPTGDRPSRTVHLYGISILRVGPPVLSGASPTAGAARHRDSHPLLCCAIPPAAKSASRCCARCLRPPHPRCPADPLWRVRRRVKRVGQLGRARPQWKPPLQALNG
jgi:hypothetical protein